MSKDKDLADLRKSYERGEFADHEAAEAPLLQFESWLSEAIQHEVNEPNAMTLATVDANGRPACRPVLIKGCDERGIVWYTNYQSRKAQALDANSYAALQFFWPELERVVRIEGRVEKITDAESDTYFDSRPLTSRIGAWASPQSQVIESRKSIVASAAKLTTKFGLHPPRPEHWGGYRLIPDYWEFWQGRASRLHDRISYRLQDDGQWLRQRLAP